MSTMIDQCVPRTEDRGPLYNFRYYANYRTPYPSNGELWASESVKVTAVHALFIEMDDCRELLLRCLNDRQRLIDEARD